MRGDEINTKSRVADGGFTLAWMAVPTVGKRVFLRAVSTIPTVMRCMTPSATTVKKAAFGRSKRSGFRRYKNSCPCIPDYYAGHNACGLILFSRREPVFFTAIGGLFVFVAFQPAYGQARLGGAVNIRELALVDISAPLWRIGRSPEKLQIFLCYSPIAFLPVLE